MVDLTGELTDLLKKPMQRLEKSLAGKGQLRGNKTRPKPQGAHKPHEH